MNWPAQDADLRHVRRRYGYRQYAVRRRCSRQSKDNQTPAEYTIALAAQQVTAAQITLDFILDERSRELYAEDCRWWDLSRTKTLVQRVQAHNAEAAAGVQPYNMLRPIPQSQIDLITEGPPYPQTPGYQ